MSDGMFWALMIAGFLVLDVLHWRIRRREQLDYLAECKRYDAESQRRHEDFMAALEEARTVRR